MATDPPPAPALPAVAVRQASRQRMRDLREWVGAGPVQDELALAIDITAALEHENAELRRTIKELRKP